MGRPRAFDVDIVLDKALETFRAKGFDGASLKDLEKSTGLRRASLYGAYGNKRALYLASMRRYDETRAAGLVEMLKAAKTGRAALELLFSTVVSQAIGDPCGCLMNNAAIERSAHDEKVSRCVEENRRRIETGIAAAIERGIEDASLRRDVNPRESAHFLFGNVLGIRALARFGCSRNELSRVAAMAISAVVK
jgi:TetR/AcrR family transcriptional repressor of nem operon